MKVKFKNGAVKGCTFPTEQMIFHEGTNTGWLLSLSLSDEDVTSDVVENVLQKDNIECLSFLDDSGNDLFDIKGYDTIVSAIVRYSDSSCSSRADIQLSKRTAEENYLNGGIENA